MNQDTSNQETPDMFIHEKPKKVITDSQSPIDWSAISKSPNPVTALINPPTRIKRKPRARITNDLYNEIVMEIFVTGDIIGIAKKYGLDPKTLYNWRIMIIEKREGFMYNHLYDKTKELIKPHVKHMREMRFLAKKETEMNQEQTVDHPQPEPAAAENTYLNHLKSLADASQDEYMIRNSAGETIVAQKISPKMLEFLKSSGMKVYRLSMREV